MCSLWPSKSPFWREYWFTLPFGPGRSTQIGEFWHLKYSSNKSMNTHEYASHKHPPSHVHPTYAVKGPGSAMSVLITTPIGVAHLTLSTPLCCEKDLGLIVPCVLTFLWFFSPPTVPSDVFFINSVWKGYYEYLGKRQPATLTVDWFNATSSKVNATFLEASQVELKLTGRPWGVPF